MRVKIRGTVVEIPLAVEAAGPSKVAAYLDQHTQPAKPAPKAKKGDE